MLFHAASCYFARPPCRKPLLQTFRLSRQLDATFITSITIINITSIIIIIIINVIIIISSSSIRISLNISIIIMIILSMIIHNGGRAKLDAIVSLSGSWHSEALSTCYCYSYYY